MCSDLCLSNGVFPGLTVSMFQLRGTYKEPSGMNRASQRNRQTPLANRETGILTASLNVMSVCYVLVAPGGYLTKVQR